MRVGGSASGRILALASARPVVPAAAEELDDIDEDAISEEKLKNRSGKPGSKQPRIILKANGSSRPHARFNDEKKQSPSNHLLSPQSVSSPPPRDSDADFPDSDMSGSGSGRVSGVRSRTSPESSSNSSNSRSSNRPSRSGSRTQVQLDEDDLDMMDDGEEPLDVYKPRNGSHAAAERAALEPDADEAVGQRRGSIKASMGPGGIPMKTITSLTSPQASPVQPPKPKSGFVTPAQFAQVIRMQARMDPLMPKHARRTSMERWRKRRRIEEA